MKPSSNRRFPQHEQQERIARAASPPGAFRASLAPSPVGWRAALSPMRAFDALRAWPASGAGESSASLLFDVALASETESAEEPRVRMTPPVVGRSLGALADELSIRTIERFGDDHLVLDAMALRELVGMVDAARLRCVLVDGPIERRDACAMIAAPARNLSPLQVEVRAVAAMEVVDDREATLETREKRHAMRLVAEGFRQYLSALRGRPVQEIARPEISHVERLLDVSGSIGVRPLETDSFATFLDVGISTAAEPFSKPAERSLIYDLPSNTWHDEP